MAIYDGCLGKCERVANDYLFDSRWCKNPIVSNRRQLDLRGELEVLANKQLFDKRRPGGCESIVQLSTRDVATMWFEVLSQYKNVGKVLVFLSIVTLVIAEVATLQAAYIVLDIIASNGRFTMGRKKENGFSVQLWSMQIGLMSAVILYVGKAKATTAIQTVIIAMGLPLTILVSLICIAIKIMFDMELHPDTDWVLTVSEGRYDDLIKKDNGVEFWSSSLLGPMQVIDSALQSRVKTTSDWKIYVLSLFFPWWQVGKIYLRITADSKAEEMIPLTRFDLTSVRLKHAQMFCIGGAIFFIGAGVFLFLSIFIDNMWSIGWTLYVAFAIIVALVREKVREIYNIGQGEGTAGTFSDFLASLCFYPFTIAQMMYQIEVHRPKANMKYVENTLSRHHIAGKVPHYPDDHTIDVSARIQNVPVSSSTGAPTGNISLPTGYDWVN